MGNMVVFSINHENIPSIDPESCYLSIEMGMHNYPLVIYNDTNGISVSRYYHQSDGAVLIFNNQGHIFADFNWREYDKPVDLSKVLRNMTRKTSLKTNKPENTAGGKFSVFGFLTDEYSDIDFKKFFTFLRDHFNEINMPTFENGDHQFITSYHQEHIHELGRENSLVRMGTFAPNQLAIVNLTGNVFCHTVSQNRMTPADKVVAQTREAFMGACIGRDDL